MQTLQNARDAFKLLASSCLNIGNSHINIRITFQKKPKNLFVMRKQIIIILSFVVM